jgi:drug/metabolite transporter (DMT)-like permease
MAYTTFPPITLGACRFVVATIVLGGLMLVKRQFVLPHKKHLPWISLSGILGITLYFAMENLGVSMTSASNAALIVASYPAVTALLELLIYRTPFTIKKAIGIGIAILGVVMLSDIQQDNGSNTLLGNLILIATGIVWAFYSFVTRKVIIEYPGVVFSFYQTIAGTLCFLPLTLFERKSWQMPTPFTFGVMIYLGVLCSVAAFMLYNLGLRELSAGTSVSLMNLVPIFGVVFSIIFLKETVSLQQIFGGVIVIAGVLLSIHHGKEKITSLSESVTDLNVKQ